MFATRFVESGKLVLPPVRGDDMGKVDGVESGTAVEAFGERSSSGRQ